MEYPSSHEYNNLGVNQYTVITGYLESDDGIELNYE